MQLSLDSRGDLCPLRVAAWLRAPVRLCMGAEAALLAARSNADVFQGLARAMSRRATAPR